MSIQSCEGRREALRSFFWQSVTSSCCNGTVWEIRAPNNHTVARLLALPIRVRGAYKPRCFSWFSGGFVYTKAERKQTKGMALMCVSCISSLLTDKEKGLEDVNRDARFNSGYHIL
jgi:hypothetical protein